MVNHENGPTVVLRGSLCVFVCVCVREKLPVGCIAGCMLKEPLALPVQGVLLAPTRVLPLVIYISAMSKHAHTHINACTPIA